MRLNYSNATIQLCAADARC